MMHLENFVLVMGLFSHDIVDVLGLVLSDPATPARLRPQFRPFGGFTRSVEICM